MRSWRIQVSSTGVPTYGSTTKFLPYDGPGDILAGPCCICRLSFARAFDNANIWISTSFWETALPVKKVHYYFNSVEEVPLY